MNKSRIVFSLAVLVLLFLAALSLRQCKPKTIVRIDPMAKQYKSKAGELIAYNRSLEATIKDLKKERAELVKEVQNMKVRKPTTITRTVTKTVYDTIWSTFETVIPADTFNVDFMYSNKWIEILGYVTNEGVMIETIYIPDTVTLVVGERKRETIVAVKHANPHVTVAEVENYTIKKKRFDFKAFGIGFGIGFLTRFL